MADLVEKVWKKMMKVDQIPMEIQCMDLQLVNKLGVPNCSENLVFDLKRIEWQPIGLSFILWCRVLLWIELW